MKKTKRNIAIIVVLLFVCAAIYFNWSYNTQWGKADAEMAAAEDAATAAVKAEEEAAAASASASDDYFAKARLTRQQSRDEALSLLKSASTAEGASQATIDSAMSAISAMASDSMTETQIENLLLAKDFSECVVYITDEGITVAVPAPADGLSTAQVATITDTIVKETDYTAPQIKVIEVRPTRRTRSEPSCKTHPRSDRSGDAAILNGELPTSTKRLDGTCHDNYNLKQEAEIVYGIQSLYLLAPIMK